MEHRNFGTRSSLAFSGFYLLAMTQNPKSEKMPATMIYAGARKVCSDGAVQPSNPDHKGSVTLPLDV